MQKIDLNLSGNPFRNNVVLWIGFGTATAVLFGFTLFSVTTYVEYGSRLTELRNTVGNFEHRRLDLETRGTGALKAIKQIDIDALELQAEMANMVIDRKAFSWTKLFNSIEDVLPQRVRMTSVRPIFNAARAGEDPTSRAARAGMPVAIEGVAATYLEFTELERALQDDGHFGRVLPQRLSKTESNEILFQISFDYYAAGDATVVADEPESGEATIAGTAADETHEAGVDEPVRDGAAIETTADGEADELDGPSRARDGTPPADVEPPAGADGTGGDA
ncbi:MAG TPA: hypothetical protein VD788_02500 [Candidatus Polarisedimenticolaceae bacterium]|nr:hypothetical protein [Candidatus Polarisedimenticolaceae bacterium]